MSELVRFDMTVPMLDSAELVAAEAVDGRVLRRGGRELIGDLAQDEVAERVTEGVVDVLEVVKIE